MMFDRCSLAVELIVYHPRKLSVATAEASLPRGAHGVTAELLPNTLGQTKNAAL
jgi:hypothetical protein